MTSAQEDPLVSICCITYNHESYIRDTLDGFLAQETSFKYEILIHDDASTDRTAAIIREYDEKNPGIIKPIYQTENQWKKGRRGSALFNFPRAKGKYIALCEGDDYWTDPLKLQRQVDFLENHPGYVMVAENGLVVNTIKNTQYKFNKGPEADIDTHTLLVKRQFPTASVLFRSELIDSRLSSMKHNGDTILWTYFSTKGKIKYLPIVSSVYRRGMQGIVESSHKVRWAELMEAWNKEISGFLPADFDRSILKKRSFDEYLKGYISSKRNKDYKNAVYCLSKCFLYQPLLTVKHLAKMTITSLKPS